MSTFREPAFDLETLTNTDTVITWLTRTNELISAVNSLYAVDVFQGDGICLTRADGIVTINVDPGPGVGFTASKELTLTLSNVDEVTTASTISPTLGTDYVLLERSGVLKKVKLENVLPPIVKSVHDFQDTINFRNEKITLSSTQTSIGSSAANWFAIIKAGANNAGFIADAYIKYGGFLNSWFVGSNFTFENNYGIFSNNTSEDNTEAIFNFCTQKLTGTNVTTDTDDISVTGLSLNFNVGTPPSNWKYGSIGTATANTWPSTWKLKFTEATAGFYVDDFSLTDLDRNILKLERISGDNNLVTINGRVYISDLTNSTQFVSSPNGQNKITLTNSDGLLNKKFTNRIVTTDYTSLSVGSIVCVSTITDGDITYAKALASSSGNYDAIGIVESVSGGSATIVLNGEFELQGVTTLDPGVKYYLSQTISGEYVAEGVYSTGILKPVFTAISSSKGILVSSFSSENVNIDKVSIYNTYNSSSDYIDIDSPNYNLRLVGGQNIKLSMNTDNEIEISVNDLAGSQQTFSTVIANGGTSVTANSTTTTLNITSSTLTITGNNTSKTINIESQNTFKYFKFSNNTTEYTFSAENTTDTLQLIAGTGITFAQNTDDSIIINASLSGAVQPSDISYGGAFRMLASGSTSTGSTVSLYGGDADSFNVNLGGDWTATNVALDPSKTIAYVSNGQSTYDSITYSLNDSGKWPSSTWSQYMPDEIAGYMIGRITPSTAGSNTTPDSKIRRLTRKDVRFFLGLAAEGFIDSHSSIFSAFTVGATTITAGSSSDTLTFEAGSGISLSVPSSKTVRITSTATPQNAFSSVIVKNSSGTTLDSFDANTSSDNFTLKSGRYVSITTDTNNDTAIFDLNISDDYVLLGNAGTTDGMGVISLSSTSNCLVGRSGGAIRGLTSDDLKWTNISTPPTLQLPYFGIVEVGTSGTSTKLNAYGSSRGKFSILAGTGITLTADDTANTLTITNSGNGTTGPGTTSTITQVNIDGALFTVGTAFTTLKFTSGSGITLTSSSSSPEVAAAIGLAAIDSNSILANVQTTSAIPTRLSVGSNQIIANFNGILDAYNINGTGANTLQSKLGIAFFNGLSFQNSVGDQTDNALLTQNARLKFENTDGSVIISTVTAAGIGVVTLAAKTQLYTDIAPQFASQTSLNLGTGSTNTGTKVIYGNFNTGANTDTRTNITNLQFNNVKPSISGTATSVNLLSRETRYTTTSGNFSETNLIQTATTALGGLTNQSYYTGITCTDAIYSGVYIMKIHDYSASAVLSRGEFELQASSVDIDSEGDISFIGSGNFVNLGSKYLKTTSNEYKLWSSSGAITLAAYAGSTPSISVNMILQTSSNVQFKLNSGGSTRLNFFDHSATKTGWTRITATNGAGSPVDTGIVFNTDVDFGIVTGVQRTINFANCVITGLTISAHATTHQWAFSEAFNGPTIPGSDPMRAWQIGAVDRKSPVMGVAIGIVTGDGSYNYDVYTQAENAFGTQSNMHNGSGDWNITNYPAALTTASKGPLYLVLKAGTNPQGTAPAGGFPGGPPGQILFIRKA
jgi:hypothetical protein